MKKTIFIFVLIISYFAWDYYYDNGYFNNKEIESVMEEAFKPNFLDGAQELAEWVGTEAAAIALASTVVGTSGAVAVNAAKVARTVKKVQRFKRMKTVGKSFGRKSMKLLKRTKSTTFSLDNIKRYGKGPCTYFFTNSQGEIKYVGKAKNCSQRLSHHYRGNPGGNKKVFENRLDLKLSVARADTVVEAECAEAIAISIAKPEFNTRVESIRKTCARLN